jgi:hypothetical protein
VKNSIKTGRYRYRKQCRVNLVYRGDKEQYRKKDPYMRFKLDRYGADGTVG